ncbi:A-kinase anchor protein 11 isoform X2 [Mastacembelus armatus]|uniref:A-kinase anchor protein 11 isoform X2 n=1 Tax=Mastacembelus armatus TaxID=205130 RepID=UPI000E45EF91|nr:A-kinase anchor protein 11 isoform X2 [Mastacembelus armatus]
MDACARIRGVSLKPRASVRKETVRDSGSQCVKSLLRNKKELCSFGLELPTRDTSRLTEIHFVCLPGQCEGEDAALQAMSSLPLGLCELLRSLHIHSLKNDEVLLLRDSRRLPEHRDTGPQCWVKAVCVLRCNSSTSVYPQASVASSVGLLGCYTAGVRYALELQALQRGTIEPSQPEEDDTNQSVSSIEDDFVTALEHLEDDDTRDNPSAASYRHFKKRDVASQTVPAHKRRKELSGSRVIISSSSKKYSAKHKSAPDVSVTVQASSGVESQWTYCSPGARLPSPLIHVSESEESDCSSPSPIIFLDEVGYQKSLLAKLDIPQVPGGPRERVEDSDSEVSEFFDSFDQFDDLEELSSESCTLALPLDAVSAPATQKKSSTASTSGSASKYVSRGCSTKGMNPHRFDQPTLPANVKKPTPLKPGSPYPLHSEVPDSPRPVQTPSEENGGPLFSPVSSSAFSPLVDSIGPLEYFWKTDEEGWDSSELRKPRDLCSLYKTYSDFASSLSKEILESVCGYQSAVDINDNKNLSCVCHKEFKNSLGYVMKLSEIQETVTVAKLQKKSQSLKDGIQRFATDLVEMSLGSALRDLQKGVSSCTTTLCHLAARLTSSVFQMAFHEIGMRHAYVLKERAINGLAGFLVGEAVSGALKEFLTVKKQIFHSTVTRFAADLAEELVFEGIMEVCQFSHPSTPLTPSDWSFGNRQEEEEEEEEVVSSYASDLSESVIQEAFIELSQADVAFTSQAAISVSLDNICYVSAENTSTRTCSTFANQQVLSASSAAAVTEPSGDDASCTVKKALFTVSGMASCIPVPQAGQALSHLQDSEETCQCRPSSSDTPQTSPVSSSDTTASTQTHLYSHETQTRGDPPHGTSPFQNFSGNMVDMIVTEACELITASKMKKSFGDCADFFTKTIRSRRGSSSKQDNYEAPDSPSRLGAGREGFRYDCRDSGYVKKGGPVEQTANLSIPHTSFQTGSQSPGRVSCELDHSTKGVVETHPVLMHTLDVPSAEMGGQRRISAGGEDTALCSGQKSGGTPGTPPSTPQQPSEVSREKQIKQFSKKLKGKLAKEFSPATPPPTPHYQPEPGPGPKDITPEADKAEFMLKLMRSLSEEADGNEDEEEEEPAEEGGAGGTNRCSETGGARHEPSQASARRMSNKEALHYAERLACHIVSMATEMDTLGVAEEAGELSKGSEGRRDSAAQFSEQTLNSLWVYAGEVAGEVINDVKRMVSSGQQCPYHRALRRRSLDRSSSECLHRHQSLASTEQNRDWRVGRLAEQWSNDLMASNRSPASTSSTVSSSSSGLSSEYPSCESVTDEYAGYLIRVMKKEGGSRELVLDQYASRLAYRSIKLGLAHASRKIKQRSCSTRLQSSKSLPDEWKTSGSEASSPKDRAESVACLSGSDAQCCCRDSEEQSHRDYLDLVNFAESLAYNITCDVTRKLHLSSVRLPKSLTDSCLYKKSKLENMAESLIRNSFSCPLLSREEKSRHYHSTGSLYDGGYSSRVMQVIEHYARKIVDDTLKMSLASIGHSSREHCRTHGHDRHLHTQRLSEGPALSQVLGERTCRYCQVQVQCPYCTRATRHHHQPLFQRRRRGLEGQARAERLSGLEIPKIHIDLDHKATFAEDMVSMAMETAKRELSNTSLNADSGIGHDGTSYAESLTAEIMTSALSNICQAANTSSPGREATESTVSQQLSVGDESLGSWSNLSFEDEHPDDNSSFLHLSDSNGNSSSWSSLGMEAEACEERMSFSPSDSDNTEDKETEVKEESSGTLCVDGTQVQAPSTALLIVNSDIKELGSGLQHATLDPQLRSMLQWVAASMADIPQIWLSPDRELQQLPAVLQRLRERRWRVGELLHMLLRYCEESQSQAREEALQEGRDPQHVPLFQWLLEHT